MVNNFEKQMIWDGLDTSELFFLMWEHFWMNFENLFFDIFWAGWGTGISCLGCRQKRVFRNIYAFVMHIQTFLGIFTRFSCIFTQIDAYRPAG